MTREELEEGRGLLQAYLDRATYTNEGALASWFALKATELLSLAEEARWRSVAEEPPPALQQVFIDAHVDESPVAYSDQCGLWFNEHEQLIVIAPTHWRPLPKGPEQ